MRKPIRLLLGGVTLAAMATAGTARAADAEDCRSVHFSDVGWSCITATTAVAIEILRGLDYQPRATVLSVPVTFRSLSAGDIDAFLGLWLPTQEDMIQPYFDDGSVDRVVTNLEGAKYTLAVPQYVHDAGVRSFADLAAHRDRFGGRIYGIEPGNDGNQIIQDMIDADAFGLGDWQLVESSEQGMLSQVQRAKRGEDWIVFLGWEPHPMNSRFEMDYLDDGDDWFGPDFGGATVHTLSRQGYAEACPNAHRLLENMVFTLELENEMMSWMLDDGMEPEAAARKLLTENPDIVEQWLSGVQTFDGGDGLAAVRAHLGM